MARKQEMAIVKKLLSSDLKKPTALVHFAGNISNEAHKLLTLIVLHTQLASKQKDGLRYLRKAFANMMIGSGSKHKGAATIHAAFNELYETSIEWNFYGEDVTFKKLKCRLLTALAEPNERGHFYAYDIHEKLEELIKDPRVFGTPKLIMMALLKDHRLSYRFYDFICDSFSRGKKTLSISLDSFKEIILQIPKDKYINFKDFKRYILKPIVQEINKRSDYKVQYTTYRTGRRIGGLNFDIQKQAWQPPFQNMVKQELQRFYSEMSGKPVLVGEAAPKQITSFQEDNFIKSIEHPVDRGLLTWALKEYGIESAQDIRNYAENQIKKGVKIQDPTKYMAKCFREGWGLKSPEEKEKEKRDKEKSQNLKMKRRRKEVFEYITEEVRRQRNECFKKREAELTEKELEQYKTEFEKEHKEKGGDPKFKKMSWFIYIKAKLLSPEIEDFRKFAKEKKFDYDALKTEFES